LHTLLIKSLILLTRAYISLVAATARVSYRGTQLAQDGALAGYWHGDSMHMLLLLKKLPGIGRDATAIVTADDRGDVIEDVLRFMGAAALRVQDGYAARHSMKELLRTAKSEERILAAALDGPTGPCHKPKALLPRLSQRCGKQLLLVTFTEAKGVIRIKKRWDQYAVPLPFCRIKINIAPYALPVRQEADKIGQTAAACL
jgi:lysophospholipid acyltransferase (LPLAT)-like uncharacterized protein